MVQVVVVVQVEVVVEGEVPVVVEVDIVVLVVVLVASEVVGVAGGPCIRVGVFLFEAEVEVKEYEVKADEGMDEEERTDEEEGMEVDAYEDEVEAQEGMDEEEGMDEM